MRLFNAKKERALTPGQEAIAGSIAARVLRAQRRLAAYLNRKTAGLSRKAWLMILFLFCLCAGTWCLCLILHFIH